MTKKETNNLTIDDFIYIESGIWGTYKYYNLNKDLVIFNKKLDKKSCRLIARKMDNIAEFLPVINDYLKWLKDKCKNDLINNFCEILDSYFENINITCNYILEKKWYEELQIYSIVLNLNAEDRKIWADINCIDKFKKIKFCQLKYLTNR